jgi:hypothetical protein
VLLELEHMSDGRNKVFLFKIESFSDETQCSCSYMQLRYVEEDFKNLNILIFYPPPPQNYDVAGGLGQTLRLF